MMNRIAIVFIVLSMLAGSIFVARSQSDPSSSLSHLSPGVAISGSDLFYDVQVPGVGGVKVTGTQFLSWVFGNVSGNCTSSISGVFSCTGGNATGIAAGTNIATSGTGTNVTVSTILTPTFTSITTTLASVTGWLTAAGVNMQTATIAGILNGSTANLTGNLTGTTGNFTGNLTSTSHQVIGFLTASGASFQSLTVAGNLTGGSGSFATSLTAGTIQATGFLTASGANFTTLTVTGLTPTGPNCLQETGGLLQATNSACSAPTLSIAAGSNISTSGTATNITVNVINNPTFTSLTSTIAAFPSYVTIGGANIFTATISNTLTMANSTTNTFGILDKADGSLYFQSGISTSGSGAVKIVNVDSGTPRFQVAVITDPNGRLSFGLDASNNPQIGFGLGISGRDSFINRQATGTLGFGTTAQGTDATLDAGTMTLANLNVLTTFQFATETMTFPSTTATLAALNIVDQTVTGGANVTSQSLATGNVTIDCGSRPLQFITNGGAYTITAPASDGSCLLLVTNSSTASATTFSGFSVGSNTGDALDTTNAHKFTIDIWRINGTAGYRIAAHQ